MASSGARLLGQVRRLQALAGEQPRGGARLDLFTVSGGFRAGGVVALDELGLLGTERGVAAQRRCR
jgi:hypothetical protein